MRQVSGAASSTCASRSGLALACGLLLFALSDAQAQQRVNLYDGEPPHSQGSRGDKDNPFLQVFLPPEKASAAIIICPGGSYRKLAMDTEGTNVARWWQEHGVAAMVLRYRLPGDGYRHPVPLEDARRAMRLVRSHAEDWHFDPRRVGIMGYSAGGHLASTLETHYDEGDAASADPVEKTGCRPDFAVLVYPVISMKDGITHENSKRNLLGEQPDPALVESLSNETQVNAQTPPTFLVRAANDRVVRPENGNLMLAALKDAGVPSALQEYPAGGHGFGWGRPEAPPDYLDAVAHWLQEQNLLTITQPTTQP